MAGKKVMVAGRVRMVAKTNFIKKRKTGPWEPDPPKNVQVFLQILNPMTDAEILAPELVGGQ